MSDNILTPEGRVLYHSAFKASKPKGAPEDQKLKFSLTLGFPPGTDLSELEKEAKAAAEEKWGDKIPKGLRSPFKKQDDVDREGYEEGGIFIRVNSLYAPGGVYSNKRYPKDPPKAGKLMSIKEESNDFYNGCHARVQINAFAYGEKGTTITPGVTFGLNNIMKTKDDTNLSGRVSAAEAFEDIDVEDAENADDIFD